MIEWNNGKTGLSGLNFVSSFFHFFFVSFLPFFLPLFRLSIAYLLLVLALLFSNGKFEKQFELKTWRVKFMHHFLTFKNFPDTALKFGAYYFQSNLANIAIAQV